MPTQFLRFLAPHLSAQRPRRALWVPVGLGLGVGLYFSFYREPPVWLGAAVLAWAFCLSLWIRRWRSVVLGCQVVAIVAAGFLAAQVKTSLVAAPVLPHDMKFRHVSGTVEQVIRRENGIRLILHDVTIERLEKARTPLKISLSTRKAPADIAAGDTLATTASLFPPSGPATLGGYDFARENYFKQLGAVGYTTQPIEITARAGEHPFSLWLADLRHRLAEGLRTQIAGAQGEVAAALIVGESKAIPKGDVEAMRGSGLAHVLAISGLHMSIAAGLMFFSLRYLMAALFPRLARRVHVKKIAAILALFSAFCYLLLAGVPVPATRSFMMVAFVMVAVMLDRRGISLYTLAWAAGMILLFQPQSMLGASFQMSFAATLAMLAFYERKHGFLFPTDVGRRWILPRYVLGIALTSLVATVATTPFAIQHFNRFSLVGMLANLAVVPLVSFVIMPSAVLYLLLLPFGGEALAAWLLGEGIEAMLAVAHFVSSLPYASTPVPSMTHAGFLLVVAGGLFTCLWVGRLRWWGLVLVAAGHLTILQYQPPDVFISDDAKQVAVRTHDGELTLLRGSPRGFIAEQFLRHDGGREYVKLKDAMADARNHITCDADACRYERNGQFLLVAKKYQQMETLCAQGNDVLVAARYVNRLECEGPVFIIDRRLLYRRGAHALYFTTSGLQQTWVKQFQGKRPWVH